jgi:hypothetical protein
MIIPNVWKNKKCSKPPTSKIPDKIQVTFLSFLLVATTKNSCNHTKGRGKWSILNGASPKTINMAGQNFKET